MLAIIIPTKDASAWPYTQCLAALKDTTDGFDVDVITIEGSGPEFSFSRSINEGIARTADADVYILLNDDCFMQCGWLDAMLATAFSGRVPKPGVVGAVLSYAGGRLQHNGGFVAQTIPEILKEWVKYMLFSGRPFWAFGRLFAGQFGFTNHYRMHNRGRVDYVTGACMLITRECLDVVGMLDESYPLGYEDTDYCLRARKAGFGVYVADEAFGIHLEGVSTGRKISDKKAEGFRIFSARWTPEMLRRI